MPNPEPPIKRNKFSLYAQYKTLQQDNNNTQYTSVNQLPGENLVPKGKLNLQYSRYIVATKEVQMGPQFELGIGQYNNDNPYISAAAGLEIDLKTPGLKKILRRKLFNKIVLEPKVNATLADGINLGYQFNGFLGTSLNENINLQFGGGVERLNGEWLRHAGIKLAVGF